MGENVDAALSGTKGIKRLVIMHLLPTIMLEKKVILTMNL